MTVAIMSASGGQGNAGRLARRVTSPCRAAHKVAAGKAKFLCFSEIHTFLQPRFAVCSKVAGDGMKNIIWNEKVNL